MRAFVEHHLKSVLLNFEPKGSKLLKMEAFAPGNFSKHLGLLREPYGVFRIFYGIYSLFHLGLSE